MRKIAITCLVIVCCFVSIFYVGCGEKGDYKVKEFYDSVKESQNNLDILADEIYVCWYDFVYNKKYSSVDLALLKAYVNKYNEVEFVKQNDEQIKEYFATAKNASFGQKVKDVMTAYSDYYEFVINVSGSFQSYSADKETKKKALATALRELYYEL